MPAGTPPEVIAKLSAVLSRFADKPETKAGLTHVRFDAAYESGPALKTRLGSELAKWRAVVERGGLAPQ